VECPRTRGSELRWRTGRTLPDAALAVIPAGAALVGVVLGTSGNAYLDRRRERRTACRERYQAIAELLTATVDLITGVQAVRAAYHQQHATFRHYIRVSAGVLVALGSTMTGAGKFDWRGLLDWHTAKTCARPPADYGPGAGRPEA
jgi:hypothetical protein